MLTREEIIEEFEDTAQHGLSQNGICMLLAQCDYESAGFTIIDENLNYTANRLIAIFPKYFKNIEIASSFEGHPKAIANLVYANRMGNGSINSNDGWNYRGRGYLQITGKDNYAACGKYLELNLLDNPNLLLRHSNALQSAIWFFIVNNLINNTNCEAVTKVINGGLNGLAERQTLYDKYCKLYIST